MFMEAEVRALAVAPDNPLCLYAGTDAGLYRSDDGGVQWQSISTPFDEGNGWQAGTLIWSLLIHPQAPNRLYVGLCPPAVYASEERGDTWQKLDIPLTPECPPIRYSRVTTLVADPDDPETLWVGVEIDGLWCSRDRGEHWERRSEGLSSQDVHGFAIVSGTPRTLLVTTNNDLNMSRDEGITWEPQQVTQQFPHGYCRGIQAKRDDNRTLFLGNGNGPPGTTGALQITQDGGKTWRQASLTPTPNSTIWTFGTSAQNPNLVFALSVNGYLYRSEDGGETWVKCLHEFGEARSIVFTEG
jgi:photosystem II stability/assembly factor-like uncharacterized protein